MEGDTMTEEIDIAPVSAAKKKPGRKLKRKKKGKKTDASEAAALQAQGILNRLSRAPRKGYRVENLDVGTLRPLVDLAYWSTFLEVRRDAAAAFATLAMNEMNLPVLSEAGALGAVIALIGINNGMNDSQIHRDAATALAFLLTIDEVKRRFLNAPDGLRSVFYICRSPNIDVKRAACKVFANLVTRPETKEALVTNGGLKYMFALAATNDEKTKRRAAIVLKRLASLPANHQRICNDEHAVRCAVSLLIECHDLTIRRDMIEVIMQIASNNGRKQILVENGILMPLLMHMDPTHSSLETITLVINCVYVLSGCHDVVVSMVNDGLVEALTRILFEELKDIRAYRQQRRKHQAKVTANPRQAQLSTETKEGDPNTPNPIERGLSRKIKPLFELEEEALRYVNLANNGQEQTPRHSKLIEAGILYPIRMFLKHDDFSLKCFAVQLVSHLCVSEGSRAEIGKQVEIIKDVISLCNPHDNEVNLWVARSIAELSNLRDNYGILNELKALDALVFLISTRSKDKDVRLEAVRALSNLSTYRPIKVQIVSSGALGYLISMSKSGTGLHRVYALATLTNLEQDTAAIRIQRMFRGFNCRKGEKASSKKKK